MKYTLIIHLSLLLTTFILIAYYREYRANPKGFSFSLKTIIKGFFKGLLFYITVLLVIGVAYRMFIPLNKNHGMTFNNEREQLGIPILTSDWQKYDDDDNQFTTYWWKDHPRTGHFKKVIAYDSWNSLSETDYYQSDPESKKGEYILAWSSYNFKQNTFEYFIQVPLKEPIRSQQGEWQVLQESEIKIINKEAFNGYINELNKYNL